MAQTYKVYNSTLATTAAPVKQPTGNAIRTMMQLAPNVPVKIYEWGCSFDGSSAATPGQIELVDTGTVFATMSTAFAVTDVQTDTDSNAVPNSSGSGGVPLGIGTSLSGFATAAVTEGTITTTRNGDLQQLPPTSPYLLQFPLGREWYVPAGHALRVRVTFGTTVNMYCYVKFEL
jgi:hypothetical protein